MRPARPAAPRRGLAHRAALGLAVLVTVLVPLVTGHAAAPDPRREAHGLATARDADGKTLIFYSAGRRPAPGSSWHHDVVVARWHDGVLEKPTPFIVREEAQEPVSVAQAANGNILVTFEDGWDANGSVTQRYGVYRDTLEEVAPYPREVKRGGHSGHAAAVGDRFIVVYSDEWIHGGGVDDLGSGFGVYAAVYDAKGEQQHTVALADARREWWPVIAGGGETAMAVWQRFVPGTRQAALVAAPIDPVSGKAGGVVVLHPAVNYYTYHVAWLPAIERFLVVGTAGPRGFARLLDSQGKVQAELDCLPPSVREASIAVAPTADGDRGAVAFTPVQGGGLMAIQASPASLRAAGTLDDGRREPWPPNGGVGLFTQRGEIDWFYFTGSDLASRRFDPSAPRGATTCRG